MIEFFNEDGFKGVVAFNNSYVTFNKSLLKFFNEAYRVRVGVDKEKMEIYFQLINKDYALSGELSESSLLSISTSKTYARVCSSSMMKYLCDALGLKIAKDEVKKYDGIYDEKKKEIIVSIGKGSAV